MGPIGLPEMMALFVIALLLFGPKKLPELGRTLGKGLSEFRRAKNELKATFESHMQEIERETRIETTSTSTQDTSHYTYPYDEYNRYDSDTHSPSRELTGEQQAAIEANAAAADPAAYGVPPVEEPAAAAPHSNPQVAGTVPRSNGVQPLSPPAVSSEHPETSKHAEAVEERHSS